MNENIKNLLPNPVAVDYQQILHRDIYTNDEMEKFAMRIIKECAKIAVLSDIKHNNDIADIRGAFNAGRTVASIIIQEHFGIEE